MTMPNADLNALALKLASDYVTAYARRGPSDARHELEAALLSAFATAATPPSDTRLFPGEESGWLIEHPDTSPTIKYLSLDPSIADFWTTDPNKATRFARQQDADNFSNYFAPISGEARKSVDHLWTDGPPKGEHDWFLPKGIAFTCCRKCGIVQRADGKNKPCKGNVRVELRTTPRSATSSAGGEKVWWDMNRYGYSVLFNAIAGAVTLQASGIGISVKAFEEAMMRATPRALPPVTDEVIVEIANERKRQIESEGWSIEHDDDHVRGELASAAAVYATWAIPTLGEQVRGMAWPWDASWFKPHDIRHDLIRAAALIVAEIERHDRLTPRAETAAPESGEGER